MKKVKELLQLNQYELQLKKDWVFLGIESVLCLCLLFSVCFNNNVWWDEAYTYKLVTQNSLWGIILGTAGDWHPPLYYLIVKVFTTVLGNGLLVCKAASIAGTVCIMILCITKVRAVFGVKTAALLIFMASFAPQAAVYSVQLRMYSWASFFVFASALYAYEVLREGGRKNWILFVTFSVLGAYTLYFACISIAFIYLFLLIALVVHDKNKGEWKKWFLSCIATVAAYAPWLYMMITIQFGEMEDDKESILGFESESFLDFVKWAFDNDTVRYAVVMFSVLMVLSLLSVLILRRQFDKIEKLFILALVLCPIWTWAVGKIFTMAVSRQLMYRYIEPSLILLWFAAAVVIGKYKNQVFYAFLAFICLMGSYNYRFTWNDEYHIAPLLEQTEDFIVKEMQPEDLVVFELDAYEIMYEYYMPNQQLLYYKNMNPEDYIGQSFWYIDAWGGWFDAETVERYHITKQECGDYGIQSMNFKIYKVTVNG